MKKIIVLIPIIITLLLIFYLIPFRTEKLDFNTIIKEVNQDRKNILESESKNDIEQYIYNVTGDKEGFTDEEIEYYSHGRKNRVL